METTVLETKEQKGSEKVSEKVMINTLTPNFNYTNKNGEVVEPNIEVSY